MIDDIARKRIEKLTDKGIEHLEAGRHREVLQVAAELEYAKGPLAFYLAGQAFAGLNEIKSSLATIRRGVLKSPMFWVNWFFLGIYLGRLNKYDEALAAYDQALLCPQVDTDLVRLNMAINRIDANDYESALTYLDGIQNPSMRCGVDSSRILALEGIGRIAEAEGLADAFLKERSVGGEEYLKRVGFVAAALARIRLQQGCSTDEVRSFLMECLEESGCSAPVLGEIKKLRGLHYSKESKYYRFVILARLPVGHPWYREARAYGIVYDVVSDSEARALEMINEFESAAGVESIEVADIKIREDKPEEPMGVYWFSERLFSLGR